MPAQEPYLRLPGPAAAGTGRVFPEWLRAADKQDSPEGPRHAGPDGPWHSLVHAFLVIPLCSLSEHFGAAAVRVTDRVPVLPGLTIQQGREAIKDIKCRPGIPRTRPRV